MWLVAAAALLRTAVRAHRGAVARTRKWDELSPGTKRLVVVAGTVEAVLKVAALVDLARRPAEQVRGPKWRWALAVSAGPQRNIENWVQRKRPGTPAADAASQANAAANEKPDAE